MKRKVKLHPIPPGVPAPLVELIGAVVAGAVKMAFNAHLQNLSKSERGMLVGSIRKRVVNGLVCAESLERMRAQLDIVPREN